MKLVMEFFKFKIQLFIALRTKVMVLSSTVLWQQRIKRGNRE